MSDIPKERVNVGQLKIRRAAGESVLLLLDNEIVAKVTVKTTGAGGGEVGLVVEAESDVQIVRDPA